MDTARPPNDDDLSEKATIALDRIETILADFPLPWQIAIMKALGAHLFILRELQRVQPPERPTLSA